MNTEKEKFILLYQTGKFTFTELCYSFGISRTTGYNILNNFKMHGINAINGLSKAHKSHPFKTPQSIEDEIIRLRSKYPNWGARKIRHLLLDNHNISEVPSNTTVNNIMHQNGLIKARKRRKSRIINLDQYFDPKESNEIWSADFKGQFRMQNKQYCYPLTVADSYSRFLFCAEGLSSTTAENIIPIFERLFKEYGLPDMLHTDNGPPFACPNSLRRMTRFSVWIMEKGITPVYSDPGKPQQNGRHERMHRDLKAEATRPAGKDMIDQQLKLNQFISDYNTIRPHEALQMKRPINIHQPSKRIYKGGIDGWEYDKDIIPKLVSANGAIRWKTHKWMMISTALCGKFIGLKDIGDGIWELYFRHVLLGYFSEKTWRTYEVETFNL